MKRLILLVTVLISGAAIAQNPIEKSLGDFQELKVYDLIEVELVKSTENKAIITGRDTDDVIINNKNGTLKIKMTIGKSFDGNKTKVILHYTSLDIIDANEGAKIAGKDTIEQFEIDLRAQEGGSIEIPLNVTYTIVKAVTGGKIKTSGTSKSQKVSLLTGGIYEGETLETDKTEVSINAAGEAYVKASKQVDAKVRAGGDVYIYGKPETINETTVLGGRIKKIE
ncbi:putative autotransporter adhesin-like protein [Mariniflexile fucanivorans]|uniref:Putative autotransporter adhesin-like protein n=1 Tax=Mariniflexile fucanivorans TaxID=264023 RepID=A0A4V2QET2_9FLAO|nr:head GIN domain-containing protein [Mariniflexile fucanivorans]TCL69277.1 putative autotransporter adhesin-like protein [Mariniflexile fucanivorans]